jgi:hypothetical protein
MPNSKLVNRAFDEFIRLIVESSYPSPIEVLLLKLTQSCSRRREFYKVSRITNDIKADCRGSEAHPYVILPENAPKLPGQSVYIRHN